MVRAARTIPRTTRKAIRAAVGTGLVAAVRTAAMAVEDVVETGIGVFARLTGRRHPTLVPFIGYGTPDRARIGARLVLGQREEVTTGPAVPESAPDSVVGPVGPLPGPGGDAPTPRSRRAALRVSLARFLTVEVTHAPVTIHAPGGDVEVRTNRDGYVDHEVELHGVEPGWLEVRLTGPGGSEATARVLIVDPNVDIGIVSDVDDTILNTGLTRGLDFLKATFLVDVRDRTPLPAAASLYQALVAPGRPAFYVSTSPWNLHEMLLQFVSLRGFPLGPLLLTDWGPSHTGLFRIGASRHKPTLLKRILEEYPHLRLVLIGDSGQEDPEIYAGIAREYTDRVAAIYIRRTTGIDLGRNAELDALAAEVVGHGVPMLAVDDSAEIAVHAAELGLLPAGAVDAVRTELAG